jgi:enoyl-CoA hydratase
MSEPAVVVERDGHVTILTLNRPEKRNAFNAEMLVRLADAYDEADADADVRVILVTGAGGNFSAGADLDRLVGALLAGKPTENEFEDRIKEDFSIIYKGFLKEFRPKAPMICAIEGYCYAGGTEYLQGTDLRVAGEGAEIAISEVRRALFPMAGSTVRLPRQVGLAKAMEMLLVGDPISGAEAARIGLVNYAVSDGGALGKARELADRIAENGPLAVRGIKESVWAADGVPEREAYAKEQELGLAVMMSNDAREGPKAFLEKRPPNYTGT